MKKAVIVSCFGSYFWEERVKYAYNSLIKKKYKVNVCMSDFNHTQKRKIIDGEYPDYVTLIPTREYKRNISFRRGLSHLDFAYNLKKHIEKIQPQLIYYMMPPNVVGKIISDYKKENMNCYVVADVMDLWPESFPIIGFDSNVNPIRLIWKYLRDYSLKHADYIIYECDLYRRKINLQKSNRVIYLPVKVFDEEMINSNNNEIEKIKKDLKIAYIGQVSHIIDMELIEEIVCKLREVYKVSLYIIGDGINYELFITKMKRIAHKVYAYGPVYENHKIKQLIGDCHFGLNIMKSKVHVGLTMKSMIYIGLGIPIINNIGGDTWDVLEKYDAGLNVSRHNLFSDDDILRYEVMHKNMRLLAQNVFSSNAIQSEFDCAFENTHVTE